MSNDLNHPLPPPPQPNHPGRLVPPFPTILPPLYAAQVAARSFLLYYPPYYEYYPSYYVYHPPSYYAYYPPVQIMTQVIMSEDDDDDRLMFEDDEEDRLMSEDDEDDLLMFEDDEDDLLMFEDDEDDSLMSFVINESINEEDPRPDDGLSELAIAANLKTRDPFSNGSQCHDVDDQEICVVCQDDLCQENKTIATLKCGHEYHEECITNWLLQKNFCPLCKATAIP